MTVFCSWSETMTSEQHRHQYYYSGAGDTSSSPREKGGARESADSSSSARMINHNGTVVSPQQQQAARHQQQQWQHQHQLEYAQQQHQVYQQEYQHQPTLTLEDVLFRNVVAQHHQQQHGGPFDDYAPPPPSHVGGMSNQMPLFPAYPPSSSSSSSSLPQPHQSQPPNFSLLAFNDAEQQEEEEGEESTDNANGGEAALLERTKKRTKVARPASSLGESRLKIHFINFGTFGEIRQGYGRKAGTIPDGLCGTNEVYNEHWRFEIKHRRHGQSQRVLIDWRITNLNSGKMVHRTESLEDSMLRETQGKTICNQVLKMALEERAKELEEQMADIQNNPIRVANLQSRIKALRPKRCLIGLLFFGLQHKIVQDKLMMLKVQEEDVPPMPAAPPLLTPASSTSTFH